MGEPPFQRLPATGASRSFGYVGVDALELKADLVDGADVVPIDDEDGWLRVGQIATDSAAPTASLISSSARPVFAAARLSSSYQSAFLARTATRLPLPQPAATSRPANLFGEPGGVGVLSERPPATTNASAGCSRAP